MIKTSTCPNCQQPVALVDAPETSLVVCPHCQEQFELSRFSDFVTEAESDDAPPELTLVELPNPEEPLEEWASLDEVLADEELAGFEPVGEEPATNEPEPEPEEETVAEVLSAQESDNAESGEHESGGGESADEESAEEESDDLVLADDDGDSQDAGPEETPIQVRCPCCHGSFPLENLLLAQTDEPIGSEAAAAILPDGTVRKDEMPSFKFGGAADEDHSGFRLASVEERPTASPASFEFASPVNGDAEGSEGSESARPRRRRRERGGMKDMMGAIFGGAAGLLITYYLLNFFGGPRFDMLHVYLPGVSHTAVHRPGWLGGPPEEEPFDSGIGTALEMEEETPKPAPKKKRNVEEKPEAVKVVESPDMPVEESPATEEKLPEDYVGLLKPPEVTADELGKALREVDQLSETGEFGEEVYEAWCRAAVAATFLDRNDGEPQTANRLDVMRSLMKEIAGADIPKLGQFATQRTLNPDRPNHGILLAGIASNPNTPKGNGYMTGLQVAGTGAQVVLASDRRLPIQPDDRVLVLGYLVDQPKENTQGLETELPQVVWVRTVLKFQK